MIQARAAGHRRAEQFIDVRDRPTIVRQQDAGATDSRQAFAECPEFLLAPAWQRQPAVLHFLDTWLRHLGAGTHTGP